MSAWVQAAIGLAALAVLGLAVCLVPLVLELRRTIRAAQELLRGIERDLTPAASDLRSLMKNLSRTAETVRFINDLARKAITPRLAMFASFLVGTRAGLRFLIRSLLGRK